MNPEHVDVVVVGAGVSGVAAGYHLQKRCPEERYVVLEARDRLGGTWDLFRYPGVRSDSDMATFGYAFNPWMAGEVFADGAAIQGYLQETAAKYGVDRHIRYRERLVRASWDSARALWTLEVARGEGPPEPAYTCRFLLMCAGYYRYDRGHRPEFPGEADYRGQIVDPQHWPVDLDYSGRTIAVIGSGATAITLVPALAERAAHVTMVQRTPTYVAARPSRDAFADALRKVMPPRLAYRLARAKNILLTIYLFELTQRFPNFVKAEVLKLIRQELGPDYDVERHFAPDYKPWDQRFCLAPDGDFFKALRSGKASVVTDAAAGFTATGLTLASGATLDADMVVPALGLELQILGGADFAVDGAAYDMASAYTYRGMMLSGLPNLALAVGYTNASWTLKVDLTCERVCRLLNHMRRRGYAYCTPEPPPDIAPAPLLGLKSGYIQRAAARLPKQGDRPPWRTYQNYVQDMLAIRYGRLEDGAVRFMRSGERAQAAPHALAQAAE